MEIFHCKTKLVCGSGACDYLKDQKFSRLLVVADPYFSQSGQAQAIGQLSGGQWRVFDRFTPDPAVAQVAQGVAVMQEFLPDAVVLVFPWQVRISGGNGHVRHGSRLPRWH